MCKSLEIAVFVSAEVVGENAFGSCSNLKTAVIPKCTCVKAHAFDACFLLEVVTGKKNRIDFI